MKSAIHVSQNVVEQRDAMKFRRLHLGEKTNESINTSIGQCLGIEFDTSADPSSIIIDLSLGSRNLITENSLEILKRHARRGEIPFHLRASIWLSMLDIKTNIKQEELKYRVILESIYQCPGCQNLSESHLSTFGSEHVFASFVDSLENTTKSWRYNIFRQHCLSEIGIAAAKRIFLVIYKEMSLEYCPTIIDLVCILLAYLPEVYAYSAIKTMILQSQRATKTRWNDKTFKPASELSMSPVITSSKGSTSLSSTSADSKIMTGDVFFFPIDRRTTIQFANTFISQIQSNMKKTHAVLIKKQATKRNLINTFVLWFERLFLPILPLRYSVKYLDCLIIEGPKVAYRFGLGMLKLFRKEIQELENPILSLTSTINSTMSILEVSFLRSFETDMLSTTTGQDTSTTGVNDILGGRSTSESHFGQPDEMKILGKGKGSFSFTGMIDGLRKPRSESVESSFHRFSQTSLGSSVGGEYDMSSDGNNMSYFSRSKGQGLNINSILASAFGIRNLQKKDFVKCDATFTPSGEYDMPTKTSLRICHFSKDILTETKVKLTANSMTSLMSWLPFSVAARGMGMRLIYSTELHGRNLTALYKRCEANRNSGERPNSSYLIFISGYSTSKSTENNNNNNNNNNNKQQQQPPSSNSSIMTIGAYSNAPFLPSNDANKWVGDDSTFVFRVYPETDRAYWKFAPASASAAAAATGSSSSKRISSRGGGESSNHGGEQYSSAAITNKGNFVLRRQMSEQRRQDAPGMKFLSCRRDSLWFGAVTHIDFVHGQLIDNADDDSNDEDELDLSKMGKIMKNQKDKSKVLMETKTRMVGPALWLDSDLLIGETGYSITFKNEPLCIRSNDPDYRQFSNENHERASLLHMRHYFFEVLAVEVYEI